MPTKPKRFPITPASPRLGALMQSCVFILAVNWIMQGMRGMDRKELTFRLLFEGGVALAAGAILLRHLPPSAAVLSALVAAHSLNFTLNGQVWVCCRYCRWYRADPARLDAWLARTTCRLRALAWLNTALCIGSQGQGTGTRSSRSDIDLRLVFPKGMIGWLRTSLLLLRLRSEALILAVPLDLYAYDDEASLDRFDQDEPLLVLLDRHGRLATRYAHRDLRRAAA